MSEIKWIKITTDIFDDEKIRIIETLPDSDTILIIWFKLLSMAGKCNDCGLIYLTRDIPYNEEMLSTIMRRPVNTIRLALNEFQKLNMVIIDTYIKIINWEKHQNIVGMEKIKEQNRIRQERFRQKQIENNVKITLHNATDQIRSDQNRSEKNNYILNYWNNFKNLPTHNEKTFKRNIKKKHLDIIKEYSPEEIKKAIDNYNIILTEKKYYWSHRWTLWEFITKGLDRFVNVDLDKDFLDKNYKPNAYKQLMEERNK